MKRNMISACIILLVLGFCLGTAITEQVNRQEEEAEKEEEPYYELTVLSPVTGELSYIGELVKWSAEYARQTINSSGGIKGIPVKIKILDTAFDPERVAEIEEELKKEQRFFLGPADAPGTLAGAEIILENGIPNIAAYSYESLRNQTAPYGISYMSDSTEGESQAIKLWKNLNPDIDRVVVFASPSESSQMETAGLLKNTLEELGMELLEVVPVDFQKDEGIRAVVQALNAKADGYISLVRAEEYGAIVTELRKRGVTEGRRITASFASFEAGMVEENRESLEGTYIWNKFDEGYAGEEWKNLVSAYKNDHGGEAPYSNVVPDIYNAVMAWKQCIEELGLGTEVEDLKQEREQMAKWLFNSPVLEGIQGEYQWVQGKKVSAVYYFQFDENKKSP